MKVSLFSCISTLVLACGLILFPNQTADAARNALALCFNVALPSLFPFFVLTGFVTHSGIGEKLEGLLSPLTTRLFRLSGSGAAALVLGMIGGYPVGANCMKTLYKEQLCTKREAEHLLMFCNNAGPSFILGAVGVGLFGSIRIGALLLAVHLTSAMAVGFLLRFWSRPETSTSHKHEALPLPSAFCLAVKNGFSSVCNVSAFIIFFAVLTEILHLFSLLPSSGVSGAVCTGVFELTSGIAALQTATRDVRTAFFLAAVLLGFGGISVHAQSLSFLSETDLSVRPYLLGKLLHAAVSALFALPAAHFLPSAPRAPAAVFAMATNLPGLMVTGVALCAFCILLLFSKKNTGNQG